MKNQTQTPKSRLSKDSSSLPESERLLVLEKELGICRALSRGRHGGGFTAEEAQNAWEWASEIRAWQYTLELVLGGKLAIFFRDDGELMIGAVDPDTGRMLTSGQKRPIPREKRPSAANQNLTPLTRAETEEYRKLFERWTSNSGRGAESFSAEQITRFSELSERISATQQAV